MEAPLIVAVFTAALAVWAVRRCWPRTDRDAALLAAVVASSANAIVTTDLVGAVTSWNPAPSRPSAGRPTRSSGDPSRFWCQPGNATGFTQALGRLCQTRESWQSEIPGLHQDGTIIQLAITVSPVLEGHELVGMAVTAVDVSARCRAEEALRDREHQLAEDQRLAGLGSWSWDLRNGAVQWCEEMRRIYGLPSDAGPRPSMRSWPGSPKGSRRAASRRGVDGRLRQCSREFRILRSDGVERWMHGRGSLELDEPGSAPAHGGHRPGHYRAQDADQLRSWLAAIVDSSDDAILSKRLDGTIVSRNKGAETLYGYPAEEVVGTSRSWPPTAASTRLPRRRHTTWSTAGTGPPRRTARRRVGRTPVFARRASTSCASRNGSPGRRPDRRLPLRHSPSRADRGPAGPSSRHSRCPC